MIFDATVMKADPTKLVATAHLPEPTKVEELHLFPDLTRYLRNFVPRYSIVAAPPMDLLHNKVFASKRSRKISVEWGQQ